jgi:hypothetical protein
MSESKRPLGKYRLIILGAVGSVTAPVRHFEAANDDEAVLQAEHWRAGRAAELWRAYRVVRRWASR